MFSIHRRPVLLALAGLAASLLACSPPAFNGIDITGADYAHDFALADDAGAPRKLADFHGKVVVIFFGYTQCPDVCPTTLAELARALTRLGPDAGNVQVLMVTLDPARDTPGLLKQYVRSFGAGFIGLVGSEQQVAEVARDFKVFYRRVDGPTPTSYTLDHTAGSFVFDRTGRVRLFLRNGLGADQIADDLRRLLH